MSNLLKEKISALQTSLKTHPFKIDLYDDLIDLLHLNDSKTIDILSIRYKKFDYYSLSQKDISGFNVDILTIEDESTKVQEYIRFSKILVSQYPTSQNWALYLDNLTSAGIDPLDTNIYLLALQDCECDYSSSTLIWDRILKYATEALANGKVNFDYVFALHMRRIRNPVKDLDEAYSQLSHFVSANNSSDYVKSMSIASKAFSKSLKSLRYYELYELQLAENPKVNVWITYMQLINKYSNDSVKFKELRTLFYRALTSAHIVDQPDAIPIWLSFLYHLYDMNCEKTKAILLEFVRNFPLTSISYAEYIRNMSYTAEDLEEFRLLKDRYNQLDLINKDSYDSWKTYAMSVLSFERRFIKSEINEAMNVVEDFYTDATLFSDYAFQNNDIFHAVEKLLISIFQELDDEDTANQLVSRLTSSFPAQCEVWLYALEIEKIKKSDELKIMAIFDNAAIYITSLDWPERLILEWLNFVQARGDSKEIKKFISKSDTLLKLISISREESNDLEYQHEDSTNKRTFHEVQEEQEDKIIPSVKKQKILASSSQENKRNREQFTIKLTQLPKDISEQAIRSGFEDCGQCRDVIIFTEKDKSISGIVEFSEEKEVLAALTKNLKIIEGFKINITRFFESTIWVTNYPPSMPQEEITEYFQKAGTIISHRFPTQKGKRDRRFCYIEYANASFAATAKTLLDGETLKDPLSGKLYTLRVEISDPSQKAERNNDTKNEVYIQNLNFLSVDEAKIREVFEKYGDVSQVRIPLNSKNEERGYKNNGYAFVVFKSNIAADNALNSNGTQLDNRAINVTRSVRKEDLKKNSLDFAEKKSVALFNLNDTLTNQQLRHFIDTEVGKVLQLEIFPQQEAALVEFANEADVGRASMLLNTKEFKGKVMTVGLKKDLVQITQNSKKSTFVLNHEQPKKPTIMVPPNLLRRRKRQ